jgi:signal transduction histidine kinase
VVARVTAATTVAGCWTVLLGTAAPWPAWTIGMVVACEVVLTGWSLGLQPRGRDWWRRLQLSGIHFGIVLVSCAVVVDEPDRAGEVALVWLTFQAIALGLGVTCWGLNRLREIIDRRAERAARARAAAAHTDLSKWLHDHVTSAIHLVRRKAESGDLGPAETAAKLAEIEHHLRARQLEELLTSGTSALGDVVGLYLRFARDNDIDLAEVPIFSDPGRPVGPRTGRLVNRAFGVLVPNAIAAGAGRLAFRVLAEPGRVVVEVEDDAGGFDLGAAPPGHGLDSLRRDLGNGSLTRVPVHGGSLMRVSIDTEDSFS